MLVRIILFLILFFIAYTLVNALLRLFGRYLSGMSDSSTGKTGVDSNAPASMVQCCQCSTYVPESDIIQRAVGGEIRQFCSRDCLQKFKQE
ncbi:MAG: hypothetical protein RBR43_05760 [Desulfuromonadaceae bacterium]|jgi:hypothetical protein|nr:hypothetical protein [Desulfuromonas sp.]MDY0185367.1 hypothetical protein [Desulfuromonadaceae bacterium]